MADTPTWHTTKPTLLELAIEDFKRQLPGWWYSVCECQVSCDASCAPTKESGDLALVDQDARFDSGFHADLAQPSSLAAALCDVRDQALAAKAALSAPPMESPCQAEGGLARIPTT